MYLGLSKKFDLLPTEKEYYTKILRDTDTSKSSGTDRRPGRFLNDGAVVTKPVTDVRHLERAQKRCLYILGLKGFRS